jgi:putative spermidine/putrescine transport system permease protein
MTRAARIVLLTLVAIYFLLPMLGVVLYSFATSWTSDALPDGYTLVHWKDAFQDERTRDALWRTTWMATIVLLLDVAIVVPAVYWQRVRNPRIRLATELTAAIPFILPFVVIAFGILRLAGDYAPNLLGTWWLIWLGHAAIAFPFLYWAVDGALAAANIRHLNEAAQACGANALQTLRMIVFPNIGPGLATGGMLVFATSFGEFALVQILAGARFENVSLYSLSLLNSTVSQVNLLAVITVITFLLLFAISASVVYLNRGRNLRLVPGARAMAGERESVA